jgi:hypothetical protein
LQLGQRLGRRAGVSERVEQLQPAELLELAQAKDSGSAWVRLTVLPSRGVHVAGGGAIAGKLSAATNKLIDLDGLIW